MSVYISGTGLFTPKEFITNKELVESFNSYVENFNQENKNLIEDGEVEPLTPSSPEFIKKASGIERRYVQDKEGILDLHRMRPKAERKKYDEISIMAEMAIDASNQASLGEAGLEASDIDAVICGCANLQRAYPAMAIEIQKALDISGYAYDMNVACSSATFSIQNAFNDIQSGVADRVLVVNPEICSGHLNFRDRDAHFIFGDACTAVVMERNSENKQPSKYLAPNYRQSFPIILEIILVF